MKYEEIKNDILDEEYSLSVHFISARKSQELNKKYRGKNKPTNVLAFPYKKHEGEIFLCKEIIRKEAKNFDKTYDEFLLFLVIHGMLHLKGLEHSSRMEKAELKYVEKYFYWNRRGIADDKSRRRRNTQRRKKS